MVSTTHWHAEEVDINITGNTQNNRDRLFKIAYTMIKEMYSKEYSEMIPLFLVFTFLRFVH